MKTKKAKRAKDSAESLEDVIRMATRVQVRLRDEGVELHWTMSFRPLSLTEKKP